MGGIVVTTNDGMNRKLAVPLRTATLSGLLPSLQGVAIEMVATNATARLSLSDDEAKQLATELNAHYARKNAPIMAALKAEHAKDLTFKLNGTDPEAA